MVSKPLTLFVLLATAGNHILKTVAQRQHSSDVHELRSRLRCSSAQLLGDVAAVCVVPISTVFRAQILGRAASASQSPTSFEMVQEACLGLALAFLSAWFFKRVLPYMKEVVLPAAQPTKGACSAEFSPQNGLATSSPWSIVTLLSRLRQIGRRCIQRRRLYIHKALTLLDNIVPSVCGKSSPLESRLPRASAPGSHGMHDWHEALPAGFLMPVDVAACRSAPELTESLQRLLADRWWEMEGGVPLSLESVPEDECLADDSLLQSLPECPCW